MVSSNATAASPRTASPDAFGRVHRRHRLELLNRDPSLRTSAAKPGVPVRSSTSSRAWMCFGGRLGVKVQVLGDPGELGQAGGTLGTTVLAERQHVG